MSKNLFHCTINFSIETEPKPHERSHYSSPITGSSTSDTALDLKDQVSGQNLHWADPQLVDSLPASRTVHYYHCKTCLANLVIPRNQRRELVFTSEHQLFLDTHTLSRGCRLQLISNLPEHPNLTPRAPSLQKEVHTHLSPRAPLPQTPGHTHLSPRAPSSQTSGDSHQVPKAPLATDSIVPPSQVGLLNQVLKTTSVTTPRATTLSSSTLKAPVATESVALPTEAGHLNQEPKATSLSCGAPKTSSHQKGRFRHQAHSGKSKPSNRNNHQNSKPGNKLPQPSPQGFQYLEGTAIHSSLLAANGRCSNTAPHKCGRYYPKGTTPADIEKAFAPQGRSRLIKIHQLFSDKTLQVTRATAGGHILTSQKLHCPQESVTITAVNSPVIRTVE
jgi:hypothetical protein